MSLSGPHLVLEPEKFKNELIRKSKIKDLTLKTTVLYYCTESFISVPIIIIRPLSENQCLCPKHGCPNLVLGLVFPTVYNNRFFEINNITYGCLSEYWGQQKSVCGRMSKQITTLKGQRQKLLSWGDGKTI